MQVTNDDEFFFTFAKDFQCIVNQDGECIQMNQPMADALGYLDDHLETVPFANFFHPEDAVKTAQICQKAIESPETVSVSNRLVTHNEELVHLNWYLKSNQENGLIYAKGATATTKEQSQRQLEKIYESILLETIYCETDASGNITAVNSKFCDISGYSSQELIGQPHKIVNSGSHDKAFFKNMWDTIRQGDNWSGTIHNRSKNGRNYFVKTLIIPITDAKGQIIKYIEMHQDITQSVIDAQELARANRVLNETSNIAKVGGWELIVETGELNWTDETFAILEVEKKEDSKPMLPEGLNLFTESSKPIIDRAVGRAIEFGEPYSLELQALTAKGNIKWVFTNGRATYMNGKVVSLSGTIQDIEERKQNEIAYNLEKQKSLHNAKLASLGELAASMAHEINNPLGIISGNAELLINVDDLPERSLDRVNKILRSTDRISHIVQGLKRFSKKSAPQRNDYDLAVIVQNALSLALPRIKVNDIELTSNLATDVIVHCNDIEVEQIFLNLLNNSMDAIQNLNEKWIRVALTVDQNSALLTITDSGTGLEQSVAEKIFDPFFSTKQNSNNSGLGLSISKELLEHHKGSLEYVDTCDNTCFRVTLPLCKLAQK